MLTARVIASDETTTRVDGVTHWQWVFISDRAVLHEIAPRRAKSVAEQVLGDHRPGVWVSDRYTGQQDLAQAHQVCLAHVLRDVQYAIDSGDTVCAPKIRDHLRWAIRVGKRRAALKDSTLAAYAAKAERPASMPWSPPPPRCPGRHPRLDALVATPAAHPAGQVLQRQIKAWRTKVFVFLTDRDVPPTNNISEREIRPSVVFRKVTNGFRSDWGAQIHAGYRSVTGTARLKGQKVLGTSKDGPYVIRGRSKDQPLTNLIKPWKRLCERAEIEGVRLHDLRHTAASIAVSNGTSLPIIGRILGHTQARTTQRYAHVDIDPALAAADQIGATVSAALGMKTRR